MMKALGRAASIRFCNESIDSAVMVGAQLLLLVGGATIDAGYADDVESLETAADATAAAAEDEEAKWRRSCSRKLSKSDAVRAAPCGPLSLDKSRAKRWVMW